MKKITTILLTAALCAGVCGAFAGCDGNDTLLDELTANAQSVDPQFMELGAELHVEEVGASKGTVGLQMTVDMTGSSPAADLLADLSLGGQDGYLIGFVRGTTVYTGNGEWPSSGAHDLSSIAALYREADGPVLETSRVSDIGGSIMAPEVSEELTTLPFATKVANNLPRLLGAAAQEKEDGYVIEYDLVKGLESVINGVAGVLEKITVNSTLNDIVLKGYIDEVLRTLFRGVKASEFFEAMDFTTAMPPDSLPEAGNQDMYDYIKELFSSKDFYNSLYESSNGALPKGKTFGKLTVGEIGEANGSSEEEITEALDSIKAPFAQLKENVIGGLLALMTNGSASGKLDTAKISLSFDQNKTLKGMDVEVSGLEITMAQPMASFPQAMTVKADGTVSMTLPAEVSLTSLSGMRYYSDEYQKGVFELGTTEPAEYEWYMDLGRDGNYEDHQFYMTIETAVTVESDSVTYYLRGEEDGIDLEFTIPMEEIEIQLQDRDYIISTQLWATHEGQEYSMTLWFQFAEYGEEYMLSIIYQARFDNAPMDGSSYGSDTLPEVFLPYARAVKTIA